PQVLALDQGHVPAPVRQLLRQRGPRLPRADHDRVIVSHTGPPLLHGVAGGVSALVTTSTVVIVVGAARRRPSAPWPSGAATRSPGRFAAGELPLQLGASPFSPSSRPDVCTWPSLKPPS